MGATPGSSITVGSSVTDTLIVTSAKSSTYTGTVGNIDAKHFQDNQFNFGMFTYVYSDAATRQQFEVINYWIE